MTAAPVCSHFFPVLRSLHVAVSHDCVPKSQRNDYIDAAQFMIDYATRELCTMSRRLRSTVTGETS